MALGAVPVHVDVTVDPMDVAEEPIEGLGPLKTILEALPAICHDPIVRSQPPAEESTPTD